MVSSEVGEPGLVDEALARLGLPLHDSVLRTGVLPVGGVPGGVASAAPPSTHAVAADHPVAQLTFALLDPSIERGTFERSGAPHPR